MLLIRVQMDNKLLSRNDFREGVFERDNYTCVICGGEGQDAHHILERRLWSDGGYYLNNGSTLCGVCHMKAEQTLISVEEIREGCGITEILLPEHFYDDYAYDKWGNPILSNGDRLIGELFFEEPVQKILSPILNKFRHYVQYPRTYHVPFLKGIESRNIYLKYMYCFEGQRVVVTEKMDGENTTMYNDYIHARSMDKGLYPSKDWMRDFWERKGREIPDKWRVCGENLYAKLSNSHEKLDNYFWVFSIWNESNECLSWGETVAYCEMLNMRTVPILYDGIYDGDIISKIKLERDFSEGWVIRIADTFLYKDFRRCVAQFVPKI